MKLPSKEKCEELFNEYRVPLNIKKHCEKVRDVAVFIANSMDIEVDVDHVERLSLLHDLMKHATLKELKEDPRFGAPAPTQEQIEMHKKLRERFKGMHESKIMYSIFKEKYPEFAESIKREANLGEKSWEEKIVAYADCVVFSTSITDIESRFKDIEERYNKLMEDRREAWKKEKEERRNIEKEIFEHLPFEPEKLKEMV